jgi:hypothetical protein
VSVLPDELTGTEQAVLLVLMAQAAPVPNPRLRDLGPELKKGYRDRLRDKGLIDVKPGTPMVLELTDAGWKLCRAIIGTDAPDGVRGQNRTLYTLMKALGRYLDHADLALADVFAPADEAAPSVSTEGAAPNREGTGGGNVEDRVRTAYRQLARRPGSWVGLVKVRSALPDVARDELDAALLRLHQAPGVSLIPEENQKTLTDADRSAAVRIGNKDNHLIAIEA